MRASLTATRGPIERSSDALAARADAPPSPPPQTLLSACCRRARGGNATRGFAVAVAVATELLHGLSKLLACEPFEVGGESV